MGASFLGWASSLVLLATVGRQVYKQWREGSSKGVSVWLFAGQFAGSAGLAAYSYVVGNRVFVATNAVLAAAAVAGLVIVLRHRRAGR